MESFKDFEEQPLEGEEGEVDREEVFLERFKGKARQVARAMILMSALSGFPGMVEKADAGERTGSNEAATVNVEGKYHAFVRDYFFPEDGDIRDTGYGTRARVYNSQELQAKLKEARTLRGALEDLQQKYGADESNEIEQLDIVIDQLERKASPEGQEQRRRLDQVEKYLRNR